MTAGLILTSCGDSDKGVSAHRGVGGGPDVCQPKNIIPPAPPADEDALSVAVADSFCSTFTITNPDGTKATYGRRLVTNDEAACIGDRLVEELGAARVRESLGDGPVASPRLRLVQQYGGQADLKAGG